MSAEETAGRKREAVPVFGVVPQVIISSSAASFDTEARISHGCDMRREGSVPGFGPSIQAMLRWASLSVVAEVALVGIGRMRFVSARPHDSTRMRWRQTHLPMSPEDPEIVARNMGVPAHVHDRAHRAEL